MPLVPHSGASAGAHDPERGARGMFSHASWVYRRCNEILAERDLDPVKIFDLAGNCAKFREEADKWRSGGDLTKVLQALVALTREAGVDNAVKTDAEINSDYTDLYAAAGAFLQWATANLPQQGHHFDASVMVNRSWPNFDFVIRVPKSEAVTDQVKALLAVFA